MKKRANENVKNRNGTIKMAKLSSSEARLFHKLMDSLLFYANGQLTIIKNCKNKENFFKNDIEKTVPLRQKLFFDASLIDSFVSENPDKFNEEELEIVSSWKTSKEREFFLTKHEKEYSLFLEPKEQKVYGVLGITDSFSEMFGGFAPVMIKLRLLPFKGRIIYDGIFFPYSITFGGGMRLSLKAESEASIQKYGVIISFDAPIIEKKNSDADLIRFYLKSEANRDRYYEKIEKLRKKSPELEAIYYQEEAGIISREIKKNFKVNKVQGHFAVLINSVIASGIDKAELEENIKKIAPQNKQSWIYRFKI